MTKQILAFLFCFIRELNPHSPLISISHIQICYQLLQTHPPTYRPPLYPYLISKSVINFCKPTPPPIHDCDAVGGALV